MRYNAIIKTKNGDKENIIHMDFEKENIYDVLRAFEAVLNYAKGEEVSVFARRWTE